MSKTTTFSLLEKVAGIRAILSVVKAVQERKPDDAVLDILDAVELAVIMKLKRLLDKPFASLTAAQVANLASLRVAKAIMPQVLDFLNDEETTRALNAEERTALADLNADKSAKRKASAEKRKAAKTVKAAKDAVAETEDMFARA